jgi:uncharacterized Zn finger protein
MTGGTKRSFEFRPMPPRRVRNGLKLRRGDVETPRTWIAGRWLSLLEQVIPTEARVEGLEYARSGQITTLTLASGGVVGRVQGRAAQPYEIRWKIPAFADQQWRGVFEAMAGEAIYSAKLLAREVPEALESAMLPLGLRLVPERDEVELECTCRTGAPCKHAAAVAYLVAERLGDDPLAAFDLRGLPSDRVLDRLGTARASRATGDAVAHPEPVPPRAGRTRPLHECLDSFWRPGSELALLQRMPPPHHAPHALLRRLGPSPLPGKFPLVGLLASVYDEVAERAVRLRDHAERLDERNGS